MNDPFARLLKQELEKELPGNKGQNKMIPESRKQFNVAINENTKISSVLITIFKKGEDYFTILFQRPDYDGMHAGQVCFPGGKQETEDLSLKHTALRESQEEIGINPDDAIVLGALSPLLIPVSNYLVHPYVAFLKNEPDLVPDPVEVKKIIISPIKLFLDKKTVKIKSSIFQNIEVSIPYYDISNHEVWGATAMIIGEWTEILIRPVFAKLLK